MSSQPTLKPAEQKVLTLDLSNSVQILVQFIEVAQQKGAYLLQEAEVLKRASDVLVSNAQDKDVNEVLAKQLLIQGIQKGQRHGCYTLNDAAILSKVVQYVFDSLPKENKEQPQETSESQPHTHAHTPQETSQEPEETFVNLSSVRHSSQESNDDLADLAEPIPLKPKEV